MAGTYQEGTSKPLSGVYTLIRAAIERVAMGGRGIIAYPFTSDWGPINELTTVVGATDHKVLFNGDKTALTANLIYKLAFKGKPQRVLGYRMATAAAAKGEATLAEGWVLETLYPSARSFTAVVKDALSGGKVVEIVEAGIKLMSVEDATVAGLTAKLNNSDFVRVKTAGAALPANTAGVEFAGGNNGHAVTATEYAAFLETMEGDRTANAFALDAVTDNGIITTVEEWVKRVRPEGFYVTFVNGGPSAWDTNIAAANDKSKSFNFRGIINVGNGADGYTAAEMAIFIAARAGSVPLNRTLTDEVIDFKKVNKKLLYGQRVVAKESGTIVFVQKGDVVVIDEGVNTLTTPGAGEVIEFGKIRVNNALDHIAKDLEAFGDKYKQDKSNTQEARETYAATVENTYLRALQAMEVIQPGYFYRPDPEYHGKDAVFSPKIDEAFFYSDITPVDSMERIYQKINVRF